MPGLARSGRGERRITLGHSRPRRSGREAVSSDESDLDLIRTTVRGLADKFDFDYWRQNDRDHAYPWEFVKAFAAGGWLGARWR